VEKTEQEGSEPKAETADKVDESIKADVEATNGKKREREEDDRVESEAKKSKVDSEA
jgi:hypothetical protein